MTNIHSLESYPSKRHYYCLYNFCSVDFDITANIFLDIGHFNQHLDQLFKQIPSIESTRCKLCIALSGGIDSIVLLHLCKKWQQLNPGRKIRAVYINHQLQDDAQAWQNFCADTCKAWSIDFTSYCIEIASGQRQGLEQSAREKRYRTLFQQLTNDELLLTAHHQSDQAETFLLNAFRQTGVIGLGGMPPVKNKNGKWHLRPLLSFAKPELIAYASQYELNWIEDPSNKNNDFRRNWLRNRILPALEQQIPAVRQNLAQTARNMQEANELLDKLAKLHLNSIESNPLYLIRNSSLEWSEQKNLLRYWIQKESAHPVRLNSKVLEWLKLYWFNPKIKSAQLKLPNGKIFRIYHDRLYLLSESLSSPSKTDITTMLNDESYGKGTKQWCWLLPNDITSGIQAFELKDLTSVKLEFPNWYSANKKRIKSFFQTNQVPPWERGHWPVMVEKHSDQQSVDVYMLGLTARNLLPEQRHPYCLSQTKLWQQMNFL